MSVSFLSFCHINARSILTNTGNDLPRLDLLYEFCCKANDFDIITVSETHLDQSIDNNEINLPGYAVFRRDRCRSGGGVLIFAKSALNAVELLQLQVSGIESVFVKVKANGRQCIVGTYYRPPGQNATKSNEFIEGMHKQFSLLATDPWCKLPKFLLGDFNDRCRYWNDSHDNSELKLNLFNLIQEFDMVQMVSEPTRDDNILDLFITDAPDIVKCVTSVVPFDNLDHNIVTVTTNWVCETSNPNYSREIFFTMRIILNYLKHRC